MEKKTFRETKVGAFLASKAPAGTHKALGEVLPDQGASWSSKKPYNK